MQSRHDRRAHGQAGQGGRIRRDMAHDLIGQGDVRQGQARQAEDAGDVGGEALGRDIGEGGAGLGQVGADAAGQAIGQPVLAGQHMADRGKARAVMVAQPRQDRRRRRGMGHLPRPRKRPRGGPVRDPAVRDAARAAVQRQDARSQGRARPVQQIQPVAMRGRGDGADVAGRATAGGDGLGHGGGCLAPQVLHVAFDMAGLGHDLRHAAARGGQNPAGGVEDHRLGDGQPVVDAQDQHGVSPPSRRSGPRRRGGAGR